MAHSSTRANTRAQSKAKNTSQVPDLSDLEIDPYFALDSVLPPPAKAPADEVRLAHFLMYILLTHRRAAKDA